VSNYASQGVSGLCFRLRTHSPLQAVDALSMFSGLDMMFSFLLLLIRRRKTQSAPTNNMANNNIEDIAELTNNFQSTGLTAPAYHELTINFPAMELLPPGKMPSLETPMAIFYREKPDPNAYEPEVEDFDFFHLIKVERGSSALIPHGPATYDLLALIKRLHGAAGTTTLDVVGFVDDDEDIYHVRLSTTWNLQTAKVTETKDLRLDWEDWMGCLALGRDEPWIKLLEDLTERVTVRAYFHVLHRLSLHSVELAQSEEARYEAQWNLLTAPTGRQVLRYTIKQIWYTEQGDVRKAPILDLDAFPRDENIALGGGTESKGAPQVMSTRFQRLLDRWLTRAISWTTMLVEAKAKQEMDGIAELMRSMALQHPMGGEE